MLRPCDIEHLRKNNYVYVGGRQYGYVCVSNELWIKLLENPNNQKIINELKLK